MLHLPTLRKAVRSRARQAGFTMIELLIVIAILGILAVAVLSAINPVEQINRGRDTGSRSDAEQVLSAIDRYNAFKGIYPWQFGDTDDVTTDVSRAVNITDADGLLGSESDTGLPVAITAAGPVADADEIVAATGYDCPILELLDSGDGGDCTGTNEIKESFTTRVYSADNPLYIHNKGERGSSTYICFAPKSQAFLEEAKTRCGTAAGGGMPADMSAEAIAFFCGGVTPASTTPNADLAMICLP